MTGIIIFMIILLFIFINIGRVDMESGGTGVKGAVVGDRGGGERG